MIILLIKTDQPQAELYLYDEHELLVSETWAADRQLAATIHLKIDELLKGADKQLGDLQGLGIFSGPGSFTGLRIAHAVFNALAYGLKIPIVSGSGDNWQSQAIKQLLRGDDRQIAVPEYGSPPRVTAPRK